MHWTLAIISAIGLMFAVPAFAAEKASITKQDFGKMPDGTTIEMYVLTNAKGMTAKIITYGGIITELHVPDKNGKLDDVVLGFETLDPYLKGHPFFGCITGRYANRIAKGKFTLDGKEYNLATNNGPNHLHGGEKGFDKKVWKAETVDLAYGVALRLRYRSPDGEEGYPGNLDVTVTYTLGPANLFIEYEAKTDKATPINLTNHSYFNLSGAKSGKTILDHELWLNAGNITPTDATLIPTGEIKSVAGTPYDFRKACAIGTRIDQLPPEPAKKLPGGYDINYVIEPSERSDRALQLIAKVREPKTGRIMEVRTTEPGVQLYTGNFLDGTVKGKGGVAYQKHAGFCLETQHYPDSPNQPKFPSTILKPGQTYKSTTVYNFTVEK